MLDSDRQEFAAFLTAYIGKNAEKEAMRRWWFALKTYELPAIKAAFIRRDQEMGGYPEPHQIVERCRTDAGGRGFVGPAKETHWNSRDLLCACNFAAINWETATYAGMRDKFRGTWVERVAHAYDHGMADAAERIVGKHPDKSPADAARTFVDEYEKQSGKPWTLPLSDAVPM